MTIGQEVVIDLLDAVSDADNMAALAVTTACSEDNTIARAWVEGLELHVVALAAGQTAVTVTTDSNGKSAATTFTVTVNDGGTLGDLNADGHLDVADVVALISRVLDSAAFDPVADLNGDSLIDVADVVALIELVLNN